MTPLSYHSSHLSLIVLETMRLQMLKKLIFTYLYINKVGIEVDFRNAKKEESFPILFNLFILFWGEGGYPSPPLSHGP